MNVILESIVGSTAYGLATPESDVDTLGIYVQPTEDFHGLKLFTEKDFSVVTSDPDRTLHEVGKFCRLALQCNPTVTELLWTPESLLVTNSAAGSGLRTNARAFLSAPLVKSAYMGYAKSQLVRLQERGDFGSDLKKRTKKHARHLLRLMVQGHTLYTTGELPIRLEDTEPYGWFTPATYFEFGEMVAVHPGHATRVYKEWEKKWNEAVTVLPEKPDRARIESIVKWIRKVYS